MNILMAVKALCKHYRLKGGAVLKAVDQVSFDLYQGETLGIIGESGCGKTTLAHCLLNLSSWTSGEIVFENKNMSSFHKKDFFEFRKNVQMIFQNASGSLNPCMTVKDIIAEPLFIHQMLPTPLIAQEVLRLLDLVGLSRNCIQKYPHEFSGGQKQRIALARALGLQPRLLICDEPTSSLDALIQMQIVDLLKNLQKEYHLTCLFISHDVALLKYMSNRIAFMHEGKIPQIIKVNE